jgi:hypothetical protein
MIQELKTEIESLKRAFESPLSYLFDYFKSLSSKIDLAAETCKNNLDINDLKYKKINEIQTNMINQIQSYENECYLNLKKDTDFVQAIKKGFDLIELKLKEFELNFRSERFIDKFNQLIENVILKLHRKLFLKKTFLFVQKCNGFEDNNFGKLIIVSNDYLSENCLDYINE